VKHAVAIVEMIHGAPYSVFERSGNRFAQQSSLRRLRILICARKRVKKKCSVTQQRVEDE
jgi:hypothetical protein